MLPDMTNNLAEIAAQAYDKAKYATDRGQALARENQIFRNSPAAWLVMKCEPIITAIKHFAKMIIALFSALRAFRNVPGHTGSVVNTVNRLCFRLSYLSSIAYFAW